MKETLKIMGLRDWVFVSGWAITYLVIFMIIALQVAEHALVSSYLCVQT